MAKQLAWDSSKKKLRNFNMETMRNLSGEFQHDLATAKQLAWVSNKKTWKIEHGNYAIIIKNSETY